MILFLQIIYRRILFSAFVFGMPMAAFAFPSNVRHGYPNCTACHVSPGGGGVLSAYGRALSREVQSTFGSEKETAFLYGLVNTPEWLDAGGDARYLQIITDTERATTGQGFWMHGDLEAAAHIGTRWTAAAALGWKGNADSLARDSDVKSRRHFLMYSITDPSVSGGQWAVRAGKFYPVFGTMPAEHNYTTRKGLGFDQGEESYNLEFSYMDEAGSTFLTPILGKGRSKAEADERGFAVSRYFTLGGDTRVGGSLLYGKAVRDPNYNHRWALGPNWIVPLSKTVFWVGEANYEFRIREGNPSANTDRGIYLTHKLTYEPLQGVQLSMLQDLSKANVIKENTLAWTVGPVVDLYPRPHFDIQIAANRVILPGNLPNFWMYTGVFHFYL